MKTTLEKVIEIAESGVITDYHDIDRIIKDIFKIRFTEFESATKWFDFVRDFRFNDYETEEKEEYDELSLIDILYVPDSFREEDEKRDRCRYLKCIMMGFLASDSIPEVRFFNNISLIKFLQRNRKIDQKYFLKKISDILKVDIDQETTMEDFFEILRKKFNEPWFINRDIEELEKEIMACGELLDILFCKCMIYNEFSEE